MKLRPKLLAGVVALGTTAYALYRWRTDRGDTAQAVESATHAD